MKIATILILLAVVWIVLKLMKLAIRTVLFVMVLAIVAAFVYFSFMR
ncbi:MAG TPA: hypothetical protein VNM92_01105 [Thermoanaerobaculia bacterium]|nr:hypothetical protein [Thermoanaerobaculia bacterium]